MKKIDTPPPHPERWPYVTTSDPDCAWIRIPTPGEMLDALEGSEGMNPAAKSEHDAGALIQLAWMSHTHELEGETPREVYRELHNAGWRPERIVTLANTVTEAFKGSHTSQEDVDSAADFSGATPPTS